MEFNFWRSTGGKCEVEEFISNLSKKERRTFLLATGRLNIIGLDLAIRTQVVKIIWSGPPRIYELRRPFTVRFFFCMNNGACWFLVAFAKKFDRLKERSIQTAIQRANTITL